MENFKVGDASSFWENKAITIAAADNEDIYNWVESTAFRLGTTTCIGRDNNNSEKCIRKKNFLKNFLEVKQQGIIYPLCKIS